MKSKEEIREEIKRKLKGQDKSDRRRRSLSVRESLYRLDSFIKAKVVLIYLSLPEEVDTLPLIERCLSSGKRVVLPRVSSDSQSLELYEVKDLGTDLENGPWGLREPRALAERKVEPDSVDCVILTGLAFDRDGHRLGRGRGFFDKLLALIPARVPRVALAFAFQVLDRLPTEIHDERVNTVISS